MPSATLAPIRPLRPRTAHTHDLRRPHYLGPVTDQPKPTIEEHARDMGVDPGELRRFLEAADHTPPTSEQTDDLPKLQARLEALERP